ncbi:MAG: carbon-nitrogen family hydrolase [Synergistaceae bacterium]|nr:carbon-nitrogen family hydrolase [Synergistaceae bacterium]
MQLRVGIFQLDIRIGDRKYNQQNVRDWLKRTYLPDDTPTAIVLPEIWDVGYALNEKEQLADKNGEQALAFLGSLAREYGVWFIGGSVMAKVDDGFVNRAQVINPKGELVNYYDKVHLIGLMDEDKHFMRGTRKCEFDFAGIKSAACICYDLRFCEWQRTFAVDGAELLFISAEWPIPRIEHWNTLLRARAIENQMFVVACNRSGVTGDTIFGGRSAVIDPLGYTLFDGGTDEGVGYVKIDTEMVDTTRAFLPVFGDRTPNIYFK